MSRQPDHPVAAQFLQRHSPRAFTPAEISPADLMTILEAARWAPSGGNSQPTRMAHARRGTPAFAAMVETLAPGNRIWAEKVAALVAIASQEVVMKEDKPVTQVSHAFDAGAAWMSLALQAHLMGLVAHAMGGFDKARAAEVLQLPQGHVLHVVVALGQQGPAETLPEHLRPREVPSPRRPLSETAGEGRFPPV